MTVCDCDPVDENVADCEGDGVELTVPLGDAEWQLLELEVGEVIAVALALTEPLAVPEALGLELVVDSGVREIEIDDDVVALCDDEGVGDVEPVVVARPLDDAIALALAEPLAVPEALGLGLVVDSGVREIEIDDDVVALCDDEGVGDVKPVVVARPLDDAIALALTEPLAAGDGLALGLVVDVAVCVIEADEDDDSLCDGEGVGENEPVAVAETEPLCDGDEEALADALADGNGD